MHCAFIICVCDLLHSSALRLGHRRVPWNDERCKLPQIVTTLPPKGLEDAIHNISIDLTSSPAKQCRRSLHINVMTYRDRQIFDIQRNIYCNFSLGQRINRSRFQPILRIRALDNSDSAANCKSSKAARGATCSLANEPVQRRWKRGVRQCSCLHDAERGNVTVKWPLWVMHPRGWIEATNNMSRRELTFGRRSRIWPERSVCLGRDQPYF